MDMDMDTTRSPIQDSDHREVGSISLGIVSNPSIRVSNKAKQRCYHIVFIIFLMGVFLASIISLTFFVMIDIEIKSNSSFWETCILFVHNEDTLSQVWSCDFVMAVECLVILVTLIWILLYLILMCKGAPIFSGCRFLDMIVFVLLAVLCCAAGVIVNAGLEFTCSNSKRCTIRKPANFLALTTSEYIMFGVAVAYLLLFFWKLTVLFVYCVCGQNARTPSEESTRLIHNQGPNVYSAIRNPFAESHRS